MQLSTNLIATLSQALLPRIPRGMIAAYEFMVTTPAIANLVRENKTYRITSDIQTGAKFGMKTLDAHLLELYRAGHITYGDLLTKSQDPESVIMKLKLQSA